jgi:hypothetical protein
MMLEDVVEKEVKERLRERVIDRELGKQFPFYRQLFVGPMTKYQARAQVELREILISGEVYPDDLEELLPTENFKIAMGEASPPPDVGPAAAAAVAGGGAGADRGAAAGRGGPIEKKKKLSYDEARLERENAKIAKDLKDQGLPLPPTHPLAMQEERVKREQQKEGPITYEDHVASLPNYGPKTKSEAMLPVQREQRGMILAWMRQPWGVWEEEAAGLIAKLGGIAYRRLEERAGAKEKDKGRETRVEEKKKTKVEDKGEIKVDVRKSKAEKDEKTVVPVEKRAEEDKETAAHTHAPTETQVQTRANVKVQEVQDQEGELTIHATSIRPSKVEAEEGGDNAEADVVEAEKVDTVHDAVEITVN